MKSNVQLISKMQLKSKVQLKRSCSKNLKITIEVSKLFAKYSKKLSFTIVFSYRKMDSVTEIFLKYCRCFRKFFPLDFPELIVNILIDHMPTYDLLNSCLLIRGSGLVTSVEK